MHWCKTKMVHHCSVHLLKKFPAVSAAAQHDEHKVLSRVSGLLYRDRYAFIFDAHYLQTRLSILIKLRTLSTSFTQDGGMPKLLRS